MPNLFRLLAGISALLSASMPAGPASAERADRTKPLNVESQTSRIDLLRQHVVFDGNAVAIKGTMVIRAARIEARETPDGYHTVIAFGSRDKHATFRQKRDAPEVKALASGLVPGP